tara:strand:+ start:5224 stop:5814 length:591 start_codon:yes stop_codon:yes gene_type:complete
MTEIATTEPAAQVLASNNSWLAQTQQRAFRKMLSAFSFPGQLVELGVPPEQALTLALATLIDGSVRLCDLQNLVSTDDRRRLACTMTTAETAQFVVADAGILTDMKPCLGTLESPEHGASILLRAREGNEPTTLRLSGPGIKGERILAVAGVHPGWWSQRHHWNQAFPLGIDMIILTGSQLLAIPRTVQIRIVEER